MGLRLSSQPLHFMALFVLAFSYLLISSSAVPVTRFGGLMHEVPRVDLHLLDQDAILMKEEKIISSVNGRMVEELDDYPGSGANNRHTPRAFTRGCSDC